MTTKSLSAYQMKKRNQTPLDQLIREYVADMQLRNLSVLTVKVNGNMLRAFMRKMAGERKTLHLAEVTPDLARAYIAGRQQQTTIYEGHPVHPELPQHLSPRTIHREVRILRAFGSWLEEQGLDNPFGGLKLPKLPSQLIEILDTDEIAKLFAVYNDGTQYGVRWQAMFAFALDTGVRIAEMIGLKADDLDMDGFRAKVWGKGAKERYVFFGNRTQRFLMRYANLYRQPDCPAFFQSLEGVALTPESAQRIIWHARKNAGIPRIHWHLLRHTFATQYIINGGNVFELQELLGHTSLEMVRHYTHLAHHLSQATVEVKRRSPLDNLERRGLKLDRPAAAADDPREPAAPRFDPDPRPRRGRGAR
jgi:site-specific recombinase XerD